MAEHHTRRAVLNRTALALGGIGASNGVIGAVNAEKPPSLRSEGVEKQLRALREAGRDQQIVQLLDGYGIPYAFTKVGVLHNDGSPIKVKASLHRGETLEGAIRTHTGGSSGDFGTLATGEWGESESTFDRITSLLDSNPSEPGAVDYWYTDHYWDLNGGDAWHAEIPHDPVEISFSDNWWEHDNSEAGFGERTQFDDIGTQGFGALFDDPDKQPDNEDSSETTSSAWTQLWRLDDGTEHTIYSHYAHTWSGLTLDSVGISYGAIPFSFSFATEVEHWDVWINHDVLTDGTVEENRR